MSKWQIFADFYQRSELLSNDDLERYLVTAEILESDPKSGIKVAKLADGNMLKFFRVKRWYSSARFFSYARSFCRNAKRLRALNVPTVRVRQLCHCENSLRTAVLYAPLPGVTFMQLLKNKTLAETHVRALGRFIAHLHDLGIYFRGLHLGNIVLTPEGQLGLIDISEMTISPFRLSRHRRLRNFERFWRKNEDQQAVGEQYIEIFTQSYVAACQKIQVPADEIGRALRS